MEPLQLTVISNENQRKIPQAIFLENVTELVHKHTAERIMEQLQEIYNKYKLMEMQLQKSRESMLQKIPEIDKAIEIVEFLSQKRENDLMMDFLLTDTIWSKATIKNDVQKVALWLGANVMVEFSFNEAKELLSKNLENAKGNLKSYEEDISFLKDQITTIEVNIARVYNQNVINYQKTNKLQEETKN